MKSDVTRFCLKAASILLATVPVIFATLTYFPLWKQKGTLTMLSGFTLLLLLLAIVPAIKLLRRIFSSPSATNMWFILFIVFFLLSKIADEMTVISLVGYLSNLSASFIWKFSERRSK